ncbi:MAG: nucleotidyl transferase AbiEii/AbiGii toxin family protein [Blastocatellia bacterium]|nr:nucleotidyl transferase AbiEii/AbiGii toxin family protein [Blastocatellia bacterium]MDQ3221442.1 nucleotidyl transferase AbiEii/AbiGii toxin family protein [Acidobacteriota bacterium]
MLNADVLTFQEFVTHEPLPLSKIQSAVLEFLQGRDDAVLFGAQAVNAYVSEPRMTQDVDILSTRARDLAENLREHLSETFHIAIRVREVGEGKGFRIYQTRKEGNRHLVDLRAVEELPNTETIENVLVLSPAELIASKVISYHSRKGRPKAGTDWRDIVVLLLRFPELKERVSETLQAKDVSGAVLETWAEISRQDFQFEDEDEDLAF